MKAYGQALVALAQRDPNVVCLGADLTGPTETDLFRDQIPDRFFNFGVAEANLMCVASGMAREGDVPFVNTFSVFATRRALDQVVLQIAYPNANVKLVGFMPGLTSPGGPTHQAIDDVAIMRAVPNMMVVEPADGDQVADMVEAIAAHRGPVYMRIKRGEMPLIIPADAPKLALGKLQPVRSGRDGTILASGVMVALALEAADDLLARGIDVAVVNAHTLKPFDREGVLDLARTGKPLLTAENHSVVGGLGSAVAEILSEAGMAVPFARVGIPDVFADGGTASFLFERYGLSAAAIARAFIAIVDR
ncbi:MULTISPECIES: transketolase C-terminal domain-containing protein [unclassified Bradyrhizobium]|nr:MULTISPECIES: transketolase C-terminal domain-containing protein [unclassified Bradyrhizobium]